MSVVEMNVGHDSFVAQALSDICLDEGIENQLILASDPYVGMDHTSPHRLVVDPDRVEAVEQIVADHFPELLDQSRPPLATASSLTGRPGRMAVGFLLVAVFVIPVVGGAIFVLGNVLEALS